MSGETNPETAVPGEAIPVTVEAVRVLGTGEGVPLGLVTAMLNGTTVNVRQRLDRLPAGGGPPELPDGSHRAQPAYLRLDARRLVTYRNDRLVPHAG